ncbi:MAG: phosphatase PAP2 family protein [Dehalococcoidia bacterium]|nr:phosphatase PAP2 family protein [Dehalococcoidia bacterium]
MTAANRPLSQTQVPTVLGRAWHLTRRAGVHEAVIVVAAFLVYFYVRGMVVDRAGQAMVNAFDLIALERQLGIYHELEMQSWILDSYAAIKVMNWIYFWGHMPLVIGFAVWLYAWHRPTYTLVRNAFLASGAIGVVIYALYPVAPPRLVPFGGYVDTMAIFDRVGYNAQEVSAFVNPFAAVPSLHFGWSLLLGAVIVKVANHHALRVVGVAWPIAMFFAVVLTGNHFILDAVAGAIVSFAGLGIAYAIHRARPALLTRLGLAP